MSNEQNYYLLKEITEAAMMDSVDLKAYRDGVGIADMSLAPKPNLSL